MTLIHFRVCFSDPLTRSYSTLKLFRVDIFLPAPSFHQSATPMWLFVAILRVSEEDKMRHLTDGKLSPHQSLNRASKLRFMTQLAFKRACNLTLSQSKEMACNWIEKHKASVGSHWKFPKPADLEPSHDPGSHKCHPSQIPVACMCLSLSRVIQSPPSIVVVGDTIPDNFSHQSGD